MKNLAWSILTAAAAVCMAAQGGCGGDTGGGSGGAGGTGSTTTSASANGSVSASNGAGGAGGSSGGCSKTVPCSINEFCDYPRDQCDANGATGTCKPRPQGCPKSYIPTCGCDGTVYGNECDAQSKGSDISNLGNCDAPAGTFPCGAGFCAKNQQYCRRDVSDVGSEPDSFGCMSLPAGCFQGGGSPSCDCVANELCGSMCAASADGDLTITCPGG